MTALIYTILIALLVAADQLTKRVVVTHMELGETMHAIPGVLDWTYILNDGASFGMMGGKTLFLIVMTCLVMGVLAYFLYSRSFRHITGIISAILILAGGIGNCIDRVFNDGKVIDFIDIDPIFSFPKFNIADCCVTCGGVLFCIFILFFYEEKDKKAAAAAESVPAQETADGCACCAAEETCCAAETECAEEPAVQTEAEVTEEATAVDCTEKTDCEEPAAEA